MLDVEFSSSDVRASILILAWGCAERDTWSTIEIRRASSPNGNVNGRHGALRRSRVRVRVCFSRYSPHSTNCAGRCCVINAKWTRQTCERNKKWLEQLDGDLSRSNKSIEVFYESVRCCLIRSPSEIWLSGFSCRKCSEVFWLWPSSTSIAYRGWRVDERPEMIE